VNAKTAAAQVSQASRCKRSDFLLALLWASCLYMHTDFLCGKICAAKYGRMHSLSGGNVQHGILKAALVVEKCVDAVSFKFSLEKRWPCPTVYAPVAAFGRGCNTCAAGKVANSDMALRQLTGHKPPYFAHYVRLQGSVIWDNFRKVESSRIFK